MKSLIVASILLAGAPVFADTKTSTPQEAVAVSPHLVQQVRADYQAGKYNDFLADMDKAYKTAKADNALEGLIEIRKTHAEPAPEQFISGYESIQKDKNAALLSAVKGQEGSFADKVRSAATTPSNQELAALQALAFMKTGAPGSGKNVDENALLDIDLEYAYKAIHLDSLMAGGKATADRKAKHLVLEMARMDKMLAASKNFENKALKAEVAIVGEHVDNRLQKMSDLSDLNQLAKGKVKPTTALEEQVSGILSNASQQLADLHRDVMNAELKNTDTAKR